jgi:UDP-N-acetylglucosamine 2-epimerase (non-hydrolysing)
MALQILTEKIGHTARPARVMLVFGTRPEAIKLAPVVLALRDSADLIPVVTVTGQHRAMLDQVLDMFSIAPDHDLDVITPRQSLATLSQRLLGRLDSLLSDARPDAVVVQGDTTSTFVAALAAFYHQVPVVHVEAGLRTWDMAEPYPEEMNRVLTSRLARLHLAPTSGARSNLLREGVDPDSIFVTGNTVIDALQWVINNHKVESELVKDLLDQSEEVLLVTAHRRESWGRGLREIAEAVADVASSVGSLRVVFPVHRNPAVREAVIPVLSALSNVILTDPLPYGDFVVLMQKAKLIVTDSGGVQEEAPSLGTPVLVVRDKTERTEALVTGGARLVGTKREAIRDATLEVLSDEGLYHRMTSTGSPYGDGRATDRIVGLLRYLLGGSGVPEALFPEDYRTVSTS